MPQPSHHERKTHFGFREVPESEKDGLVAGVFHSVANKYDLMNDLMSLGVHRLWKQYAVEASGVRAGMRVLDVAGGTGDLAAKFALRVGWRGQVVLADINYSMLEIGRGRLADEGYAGNVAFVQANAENLPFPEDHFDRVSIAFGLRNVTHIDRALASMFRILKPGGALLVLEFSRPVAPGLSRLYDAYSFNVLPWLGRVVAHDEGSYRYLAESIRKHPDQETLKTMMERAGFERVQYFNLTGGIVALHKAYKY
ncbi:MAG: bifunctional demethylmenaquinone methyltransferase/2-methoxy-6-polyprenyl-1,4-benzoquinol methylase UbiE [Sulfuricaulis sp.]|uniref:bifunctional demethylmenaquinone methyltransferase/2-methoxy-6-polyprenyl-1,4-benzoquinol methylase UbiE n=1 Tax=Sulfuricaulis sp. TaxID=2003553 RepID=UPI0025DC9BD5|nr:bifunctional demethylmenaquinone methyltransferase/2-methoxy-6-polyprenyl-1,4-benzoquinol methylase UbiE [Sulfuricaulis sp.]MCR4346760.1 bifunctional demethylmenaquinone methyltransferase/2-methoxy-6-polyprenyl-1,4-benzoquinol methylase UbiE [Sulfuricaulis sp.]